MPNGLMLVRRVARLTNRRLSAYAIAAALLLAAPVWAAAPTDLAIRATSTSFTVGRPGMYTVTVTNRGSATTDVNVHVIDTLPDGLSYRSVRSTEWSCSAAGNLVDCYTETPLGIGDSTTFSLTVGVCTAAYPSVDNPLRVVYPDDTNPANDVVTRFSVVKPGQCIPDTATPTVRLGAAAPTVTATPTTTPTPAPAVTDLRISQITVGQFRVEATGLYFITVTNAGALSTNVPITVSDVLPDGLSFVSGTGTGWTCTAVGQAVTCTYQEPLTARSGTGLTLTTMVGRAAYPSVTNSAILSYAGDSNPANNTARRPTTVRRGPRPALTAATPTPLAPPPVAVTPTVAPSATTPAAATDLAIAKSSTGAFRVGRTGTYFLTVTNLGATNTDATITVTDGLPAGLSYVSATGTGWTCGAIAEVVTCTHPDPLAARAGSTITLTALIGRAAFPTITNSARVAYAGDTNAANNTAHRPTTVRR